MVPLDVAPAHLTDTIRALARSKNVAGIKLTMPHKPAAFALCDEVGPAARFEGVVATSLGLHEGQPMPMDPALLPERCAVFDIIAARRTELMQAAAARGLQVVDGTAMIRHQLPLQTRFWRGET
jgi:shikimate 5-dehydrogenase